MTKNAKLHNIPVRRLGRHTPDALNNDENIPAVLKPVWFPRNRGGFPMPLPAWSWIP